MLVLSFGGSLGAKPLNEAMLPILLRHAEDGSCYHIHSVGTNGGEYLEKFAQAGFTDGRKGTVEVRQYIDNMDVCMAAADLVIGRAGASSLSEIEAMGKASILIPSPYVAENHQFHNAMALVNRNAARILEEKDLSADTLSAMMDELLSDKEKLFEIERNAKAMSVADARSRIADVILDLAKAK
jgi:UDP-N-acetylglucosamine--N-acetylmuramyl-(pentapeptide) pyrophosphoryl-undecaprenol N-acetylglucosamine transferase